MPASGLTTTTPSRLWVGPAVVYRGATPVSTSDGSVRAEETFVTRQPRIAGLTHKIAGLDRVISSTMTITGTFLERSAALSALAQPGGTTVVAGGTSTMTPPRPGVFLATNQYDANIRMVIETGDGGMFEVQMDRPLLLSGPTSVSDPEEGGTVLTWEARNLASDPDAPGYTWIFTPAGAGGGGVDPNLPPSAQDALVLALPLGMGGGAQTIASLIGPNGQLGSTAGADTNDPAYVAGPPPHLTFGSDDFVTFGDVLDATLMGGTGWTIMTAAAHSATDGTIVSKDDTGQRALGMLMLSSKLYLEVFYGSGGDDHATANVASASGNQRYAASFDPPQARAQRIVLYRNGAVAASVHGSGGSDGTVADTTTSLRIGQRANGAFPGIPAIGPLYLYNRPLTLAEVSANHTWLATNGW
jgi:hypothetical protein